LVDLGVWSGAVKTEIFLKMVKTEKEYLRCDQDTKNRKGIMTSGTSSYVPFLGIDRSYEQYLATVQPPSGPPSLTQTVLASNKPVRKYKKRAKKSAVAEFGGMLKDKKTNYHAKIQKEKRAKDENNRELKENIFAEIISGEWIPDVYSANYATLELSVDMIKRISATIDRTRYHETFEFFKSLGITFSKRSPHLPPRPDFPKGQIGCTIHVPDKENSTTEHD
jgi:hypothetical protein